MKKLNVVKLVAVLATVVCGLFIFTACQSEGAGAIFGDQLNFTWENSKAEKAASAKGLKDKDGKPDATQIKNFRAFAATATKHISGDATITIKDAGTIIDKASNTYTIGSAGFVFGLSDTTGDKDVKATVYDTKGDAKQENVKFYDFGVIAFRWHINNNDGVSSRPNLQYYVQWCEGCPNTVFGYTNNQSFVDTISEHSYGNTTCIVPNNDSWEDLEGFSLNDKGELVVKVETTMTPEGGYQLIVKNASGVAKATVNIANTVTGFTQKTQAYIGRYLSVPNGSNLKGSIAYSDIERSGVRSSIEDEWIDLAMPGYVGAN